MEKLMWVKPEMEEVSFAANEYVAACGEKNKVYLFTCDAGGGESGDVWTDAGENLTDGILSSYHACNKTHQSSTLDEYLDGTFYYNYGNDRKTNYFGEAYESLDVKIWTDGGTDVHCTTEVNMNEWETAKS